jgi:hypothetical protein
LEHAAKAGCNLRELGPRAVGISFDETTTRHRTANVGVPRHGRPRF